MLWNCAEGLHFIAECTGNRCSNFDMDNTPYMYMNDQSLKLGKAKQLHLKTTPSFSRENEELPQAQLEPATFCMYNVHVHVNMYVYKEMCVVHTLTL